VWNMFAMCRCLLRLGFRVCSYDLVLLTGYACMRKMRSCCVLGCWCWCLLRLWFRVCSHGLILLSGYACTRKKWFLDVFWIYGVKPCFVYGLWFVHMVCSCLLVMHVREKNGFLLCSGLLVSIFHPPMSSFHPWDTCVCCKTTHNELLIWTELTT